MNFFISIIMPNSERGGGGAYSNQFFHALVCASYMCLSDIFGMIAHKPLKLRLNYSAC